MKRLALLLLTCFAALLLGGCYGSYELPTEEPASLVIFTQPALR